MDGRLFTLSSEDDYDAIFAWGMEITHDDGNAAVIYRWDPCNRRSTHGVHETAESARLLYSHVAGVPLKIVWMDLREEVERLYSLLYPNPAEAAIAP